MANSDWGLIKPSPDNDFAMVHNPLYSGTIMLKLLLDYHYLGIALSNHHLSIFCCTHLYNALQHLKMLETSWPVMDRIIELHKKSISANDIPKKTIDMAARLFYRIDAEQRQKRHLADAKWEFKPLATMEPLRLMLAEDAASKSRALHQIEQLEDKASQTKQNLSSSNTLQHRKPTPTPAGYARTWERAIASILSDLSIDYIRLTKIASTSTPSAKCVQHRNPI